MQKTIRKLSQNQKVIKFLKDNSNKKFTAREIAENITQLYEQEYELKRKPFSSHNDFISQVVSEIGCNKDYLIKASIQLQDKPRPRVFWYDSEEIKVPGKELVNKFSEKDLYPLLIEFLNNEFGLFCLRINEKTSSNLKGLNGNKWLHPDIVAMQVLDKEWDSAVQDCAKASSGQNVKLWSFEVKKELTSSNVRESFFQAVSNSSWANEGYLVATSIPDNILNELRILSSLHGIGVILLAEKDISESDILLPAKQKIEVDWQSVNRIVKENKDFKEYIDYISVYYRTGKIFKNNWNK
ncbi:HrgA protein [Rodentibacter rarus]|uniref:HrgA protein n=1 Tax=Rodentibacter rarus TaxID=1908260 RepID=A0A1V3IJS1_9PAST|nr:HrgA protein [Rodentibacter rarus]OOF41483.1 HrgA protein [Rodentibacter rarus]